MEAECLAPLGNHDAVGDERVSRRVAQPLAEPIDTPGNEDSGPCVARAMSNLPNAARP
jgi:hypothetical protein